MSPDASMTMPGFPLRIRIRRVVGPSVVSLRAWIPGGARSESTPGQALVTGRLLTEGTRRWDWQALAEEAESRGIQIAGFAGYDFHGLALDALAEDWRRAADWTAELLVEGSFPEDRCRWVCRRTEAELASLADLPDIRTGWSFLRQLYGDHPLGRPLQGDPAALRRLGPDSCRLFHGSRLAEGVLVTVAGAVDEEAAVRDLEARLGPQGIPGGSGAPATEPSLPRRSSRGELKLPGADQAHLFVGQITVPRAHPDTLALEVAGVVLGAGAGLTGRIPERVRERDGLAYTAHAETVAGAGKDPGRLVAYVATSADRVERAAAAVDEEIRRLVEEGIGEDEVEEAKSYLTGRDPFQRETARQWAELLAEAELYGVPVDRPEEVRHRIEALEVRQVVAAVRRHVDPDTLAVTIGLPA